MNDIDRAQGARHPARQTAESWPYPPHTYLVKPRHPDTRASTECPLTTRGGAGARTDVRANLDPYTGETLQAFTTDQWLSVQHMPRVFPKRASDIT